MILAHGIGGRGDLPVPLWLALYGAGAAVVVSFLAMIAFWPQPRLRGARAGRAHPVLDRWADGPSLLVAGRTGGVVLAALLLAVAWSGPDDSSRNPAPTWFYVWFWVGLPVLSAAAGPVWRRLNPVRTMAALLGRLVTPRPAASRWAARSGHLPAAVGLFAFAWLELVMPGPDEPRVVAAFVTGYGLVQVVAATLVGPRWCELGDGFEVYSTLIGHLSPLGRRADGRMALHNPLNGLAAIRPVRGLVLTVAVLLGSTAFDGASRSQLWRGWTEGLPVAGRIAAGTAGLLAAIALVLVTYTAANRAARGYASADRSGDLDQRFVHSLLPIALGYALAHYFSLLVFQGQAGLLLATDPWGRGWDLLGLSGRTIDYGIVSPQAIAAVQVGGIVLGHVAAVVSAHDRAVATFAPRHLRRAQYPMVATMVGYTVAGIALVVGT